VAGRIRELEADAFRLEVNHALVATRSRRDDSIKRDRECLDHADGWCDDESRKVAERMVKMSYGRGEQKIEEVM
jgi:hypothetical protein